MTDSGSQPRLELSYPCEWPYVLIGENEAELRAAVKDIVQNNTHTIIVSNTSTQGKYVSLRVLVEVRSDEDRVGIFQSFKDHSATKVVI